MKKAFGGTGRRAAVLSLALVLFALLLQSPWTQVFESWTIDWRLRHFNRLTQASDSVVVIDIDDASVKSLEQFYGRWPFPRRVYKDLLEYLALGSPKAVLFDLLFTGADKSGEDDDWLAKSSSNLRSVSHALHLLTEPTEEELRFRPAPHDWRNRFGLEYQGSEAATYQGYRDFTEPTPAILARTPGLHVITFPSDRDGVLRRAPLVFDYQGLKLPSLALKGVLMSMKNPRVELGMREALIWDGDSNPLRIPLDGRGKLPVAYYRSDSEPKVYPLAHVLANARLIQSGKESDLEKLTLQPDTFAGKTIVIGASAAALYDLKPTSLHPAYPGSMVQATVISQLLLQDFLRMPSSWTVWILTSVLFLLVYGAVTMGRGLVAKSLGATGLFVCYFVASVLVFHKMSYALPLFLPALAIAAAVLDGLLFSVLVEARQRKRAQATLAKYLAPAVVAQLIDEGIDPQAEVGRQAELTILFSDIRGFTSISEKHPPQVVVEHLNQYLAGMTDSIFLQKGTLDKFIGDAVMAFWGAPLANPMHALDAVKCAFRMRAALTELQLKWGTTFSFDNGIGINTGTCIVGNIGSEKKLDYTVIGDNVNLASRIEGLTKEYGAPILIGENTFTAIQSDFGCRVVDKVRVKGKERYVKIYQPIAEKNSREWERIAPVVARYDQAWLAADAGDIKVASELFKTLAAAGDYLSEIQLQALTSNKGGKQHA